jgi:PKD repeat protein
MNKINFSILFALTFLLSTLSFGEKRKILFIGNSYTAVNDLPNTLKNIALSFGDTLEVDNNTPGGMTLNGHTANAATLAKIQLGGWDYVVVQAQSQEPSFDPTQVASNTYPYAKKLDSLIHVSNPCAETIFYMTWGRKNGDSSNCPFYSPVCTYAGMQKRLRESYLEMSLNNNASCAPAGVAWKRVRDNNPSIELYNPDQSHPSLNGTYLVACTFYSTLYHKSCVGSTYVLGGVSTSDATILQTIASNTVLDSLETWQQHGSLPKAKFASTNTLNQYSFTNQSLRSNNYEWNFGDGSSVSTQVNPTHTFSAIGTYTIALKAKNNCSKYDEFSQNAVVTSIATSLQTKGKDEKFSISYTDDYLNVINDKGADKIKIFDSNGKLMSTFSLTPSLNKISFYSVHGIYFYSIQKRGRTIGSGKFEMK